MKRAIFGLLALISGALFASEVVSITDLTPGMMEALVGEESLVIKIPEGAELPIGVCIKGDFFSSQEDEAFCVNVLRDLYVKCQEDDTLVSADGENWKTFSDFFTGSFGWSIGNHDGEATEYSLYLDANQS